MVYNKDIKGKRGGYKNGIGRGGGQTPGRKIEMESIKEIVKGVENGSIDIEQERGYETKEYIDGATEYYEVHKVTGYENVEVWFAEHARIQALRDEVYNGDKPQKELDEVLESANEPADIYDYDKLVAVRNEDNILEWL